MLWYCGSCTTAYSVGAPSCPHCGQPSAELVSLPADTEPEPKRRRKAEPPSPEADSD